MFFVFTTVFTVSSVELFYVLSTKTDGTTYLSTPFNSFDKAQEQASRPLPSGVVKLEVVSLPASEAVPF